MGLPATKLNIDQFLEWENAQPERNEFYRGEVFAMVGVRRTHALVSGNVFNTLKNHLHGSGCEAFTESVKVKPAEDSIFYPDVFVTCDKQDLQTDMVFTSPIVIVEVLSDSTQAYDRGLKFAAYRQIAALKEYLLIDPTSRVIELYRRGVDQRFTLHDCTAAESVELVSISCTLTAQDIFRGISPTTAG